MAVSSVSSIPGILVIAFLLISPGSVGGAGDILGCLRGAPCAAAARDVPSVSVAPWLSLLDFHQVSVQAPSQPTAGGAGDWGFGFLLEKGKML